MPTLAEKKKQHILSKNRKQTAKAANRQKQQLPNLPKRFRQKSAKLGKARQNRLMVIVIVIVIVKVIVRVKVIYLIKCSYEHIN